MRLKSFAVLLSLLAAHSAPAPSAAEVVGSAYHADTAFPEFTHLWSEGWKLKDESGDPLRYAQTNMPLGAYVHIYLHNRSPDAVPITDVKLEGVSLKEAIAFSEQEAGVLHPASAYFSKLPQAERERLFAAGDPVWWKVEPASLPPAGFGAVTVRLRRQPKTSLTLEALSRPATWTARVAPTNSPRFVGISFSHALDTVFCYLSHPRRPGTVPVIVLLDGADVTSRATMAADPAVNVTPLVIRLPHPLAQGSFHCFQAIYGDGSAALAGIRAWGDELVYGMWGYVNQGRTAQERVDYFLGDLQRHNVNAVMASYGGEVSDFLSGQSGVEHSRATGIRAMRNQPGEVLNPLCYLLMDEPDVHDYGVTNLPAGQRLGALGQALVRRSDRFRQQDAVAPHLLNLDNTYKPENWYMYAQLGDVCSADPYYQEQQRIVWNNRPGWAASFLKPLYVLGAATVCQSACAPKLLHIILNSVRHDTKDGPFRFATPEEKTVELFYALGAGARGFSYWWYTPYGEYYGCGAPDKEAVALWRQIGLLGAQVRTAGPVLTRSCPAAVPLKASGKPGTRTLLAGTDTLVLLVVNENIASDRLGTVVVPLPKTAVSITPPSWLKASDAFEITPQGLQDVTWKCDAAQLVLDLGRTDVARMVLLTADKTLRGQLEGLYQSRFAANVARLTATQAR
jgi:hypothetical protein